MAHDLQRLVYLEAVEAVARELVTTGMVNRGVDRGLVVIEKADKSDPHYRLCALLESTPARTTLTANPPDQLEVLREALAKLSTFQPQKSPTFAYQGDGYATGWTTAVVAFQAHVRAIIAALHPGGLVVLVGEEQQEDLAQDPALVASPSSPQAVSTKGFDRGEGAGE